MSKVIKGANVVLLIIGAIVVLANEASFVLEVVEGKVEPDAAPRLLATAAGAFSVTIIQATQGAVGSSRKLVGASWILIISGLVTLGIVALIFHCFMTVGGVSDWLPSWPVVVVLVYMSVSTPLTDLVAKCLSR